MVNPPVTEDIADCVIGLIEEKGIGRQSVLAHQVANELRAFTLPDGIKFGTLLTSGRENGLTFHVGGDDGWVFAIYEHRGNDDIVINGVPRPDLTEEGPYVRGDYNDVLCRIAGNDVEHAARCLVAAFNSVPMMPNRAVVKSILQDQQ
ncbi:hypothetical protein SEA_SEPHIROTH_10 [Gordonia Phage Sephiroth]|uniref:Uncharacterized protein n=1 Tax=Gordonia Phage Sephiroth TaxID=2767553 RepID=A0A7G9UZ99_9CAUD|nr:hypothetical protein L3Y23_gp010 [Gordonia Phage Sephiroth]QNN99354.1 hypothetical protein SEA_SEPHIROTH_10 [Gordonia Phage Sephiroth]